MFLSRGSIWSALIAVAALALLGSAAAAQAPRDLRFEQFSVEQGLAQESVTAMLQDRHGFMWFGSQAGLTRYDGYRVIVYRNEPDDPTSLVDNLVTALHEDASGHIWVGTRGGLQRFDPELGAFKRYSATVPASRGRGSLNVRAILGDVAPVSGAAGKVLWIATADGLQRLDSSTGAFTIWHHDATEIDSLGSDEIQALAWDHLGRLLIGTPTGLDRLVPGSVRFEHLRLDSPTNPEPKRNSIQVLKLDASQKLWIGSLDGLETWDLSQEPAAWRRFGSAEGLQPGSIQSILQDQNGTIWIGTDTSGLLRWDTKTGRFGVYRHSVSDRNSLADDNVYSLFQDRSGTLWVGTWQGGSSRVDLASGGFERFVDFAADQVSVNDNKVFAISGDRNGSVWLGTVGGGLHQLDPTRGVIAGYRHDPNDPASLPDDTVRGLHVDAAGRTWAGTSNGLARLDSTNGSFWSRRLSDQDPAFDRVRHIAGSANGILWIGTEGGLVRYDPDTDVATRFSHDPGDSSSLSQGRPNTVLEDRRGTLWVGTDSGLDRLDADGQHFTHIRHVPGRKDSLSHNRIYHLNEDRAGRLWIGTAGGLNRLDEPGAPEPRFHAYTRADGLDADVVGASLEDRQGYLWISTTTGISRLDPRIGEIRNFSGRDGLIGGSYFISSAYADEQGTLYFGGLAGLTAFRPEAIRSNDVPPAVVITELQVFNRPVRGSDRPDGVEFAGSIENTTALRLSHAHSVFSLEFAGLHFADPGRNRYAYKLDGFNQEWIETDASRRFVTYTNLDPGNYTFRVKAANKDGVWNQAGAALRITITPPVWATWWFRTAAGALLIGGIWALYRYRIRGLTRQRQTLKEQVDARTAEVVEQKEDIEQAHRNLSVLSEIGREITAMLDAAAVFDTLDRHVHDMLDATVFGIYLLDRESEALVSVTLIEDGKTLPLDRIVLSSPTRYAARCARERRELLINRSPQEVDPSHVPGTLEISSSLFAPLTIGERLLGVMTVQSPKANAYGEREQLIFRTLCAYGAIALDNAAAYRQLKETDAQRALYAISDVVSSELDRGEMFRAVHKIVGTLMYAENFFIVLYNRAQASLRIPYFADVLDHDVPHPDTHFPENEFSNSLTLALLRQGSPLMGPSESLRERLNIISDVRSGPLASDWLGVPMLSDGEVRGAVVVQSYDKAVHYTESDRALLSYVAQHILSALTRRQAQEELEQRVELRTRELAAVNDQLGVANSELVVEVEERKTGERLQAALFRIAELTGAASSIHEFFGAIHGVVGELLYAKNFFIALLADEGRALDCPYAVDEYDPVARRPLGRGLTEYVLRTRRPLLATRAQIDALGAAGEVQSIGSRCICWMGVPLVQNQEMLGAIVVQSYSPEVLYTSRDQELLTFVSLHIATALQRRRGQDSLLQANTELENRVQELRRAQAELMETESELNLALAERKRNECALLEAKDGLERGLAEVEQTRHQVTLLAELSSFLQACPSADDAFVCIGEFGPRLFPESLGAIYLADEIGDTWVERGGWDTQMQPESARSHSFLASQCWALRRGQAYRADTPATALCCPHVSVQPGPRHPYACLPLTAQGKTFGLLFIEFKALASGAEADRRHSLGIAMAEQTGLAIANIRLREALLQQSIRDPLTGLYNRRFMQEALFREMAHSKRNQTTLAVLMIDVDHFKKFNDTFGHPAGDLVLQHVARTIDAQFRRSDVCCRFGGEEFTVLLPGTSIELAQRLANALLEGIRTLVLTHEGRALDRLTASVGVALFPTDGNTPQSLVEAADSALYQAKTAGRNRVSVCGAAT